MPKQIPSSYKWTSFGKYMHMRENCSGRHLLCPLSSTTITFFWIKIWISVFQFARQYYVYSELPSKVKLGYKVLLKVYYIFPSEKQLLYIIKKFSVKKGTLPLRWVSSPGPFDCRSNALSSELRRFHNFSHRNLLTPILASW